MVDNGIHGRDLIINTKDGNQCVAKLDDKTKKVSITKADGSVAAMQINEFQNWLVENAKDLSLDGQPQKDTFQKTAA